MITALAVVDGATVIEIGASVVVVEVLVVDVEVVEAPTPTTTWTVA